MTKGGLFYRLGERRYLGAIMVVAIGFLGMQLFSASVDARVRTSTLDSPSILSDLAGRLASNSDINYLVKSAHFLLTKQEAEAANTYIARARNVDPTNRDANLLYAWANLNDLQKNPSTISAEKLANIQAALAAAAAIDPNYPLTKQLQASVDALGIPQ